MPELRTIEAALAEALAQYGVTLVPKASGRFERFDTPDKPKGHANGWYRIHSPEAASFGIWHMDLTETVTLDGPTIPRRQRRPDWRPCGHETGAIGNVGSGKPRLRHGRPAGGRSLVPLTLLFPT